MIKPWGSLWAPGHKDGRGMMAFAVDFLVTAPIDLCDRLHQVRGRISVGHMQNRVAITAAILATFRRQQ